MRFIRNFLAIVGLLALIGVGYAIFTLEPHVGEIRALDGQAPQQYSRMLRTVLETGDAAAAMTYRQQVAEGRSADEVEQALRAAARERGLRDMGELALDEEIREAAGDDFPLLRVYMLCDFETAADMVSHSTAMAAFLPCRIVLQEDGEGDLWLVTQDLKPLVHGGHPLPADLAERMLWLQLSLEAIIKRAAAGRS